MAKDDYNFLVFKILTYLYACFRRRCHFETTAFKNREDLIEGLTFVNAWGNDYTLASDYADMFITP